VSDGKRFVIGGLSRLTVRVASLLAADDADVLVLVSGDERGSSLARRLVDPVRLSVSDDDPEVSLVQAGVAEATKRKDEPVRPPAPVADDIAPGDTVVVAGPPDAVRDLLAGA
jgi:hypothetical protein